VYEGAATRLVTAWKEGGRRLLAREAATVVTDIVARPTADGIAFVPGVSERLLWRGHNSAEGLARELCRRWELPLVRALSRARPTTRQRDLSREDRRRNVKGAFAASASVPPALVLVDDVYTTGSTVSAAAAALERAGATRVEVVTFARALRVGR
jgi:ComF family protein